MMDFLKDERPNEYEASFYVQGTLSVSIRAGSIEEAKQKAQELAEDEEFGLEVDEVSDVSIGHVWKSPALFLVTRNGKPMKVSRLQEGDMPRQPDVNGF